MTLTVRISNEGNQPGDTLMIRGVTANYYETPDKDGCIGSFYFGGDGTASIPQGGSMTFCPNYGHFRDFDKMEVKGKH